MKETEYACPKCLNISKEDGFCSRDGEKLIPFNATCECGKPMTSWTSIRWHYLIYARWSFPKFLYERFTPESLYDYCGECGCPLKQQYKT